MTTTTFAVVVDGSKHAHEAFETACRLIGHAECELLIVTYVETASRDHLIHPVLTPRERTLLSQRIDLAQRALAAPFLRQAQHRGMQHASIVPLQGPHAGLAICHLVEQRRVDYLVMSRLGLNRDLAAQTADYVTQYAPCHVALVQGELAPRPTTSLLKLELDHYAQHLQQHPHLQQQQQQQIDSNNNSLDDVSAHVDNDHEVDEVDHRGRRPAEEGAGAATSSIDADDEGYDEGDDNDDVDDDDDHEEMRRHYAALGHTHLQLPHHQPQKRRQPISLRLVAAEDDDYAEFAELERQEWLAARQLAGQLPLGSSEAEDLLYCDDGNSSSISISNDSTANSSNSNSGSEMSDSGMVPTTSSTTSGLRSGSSAEWAARRRRTTVGSASEAMAAARKSSFKRSLNALSRRRNSANDLEEHDDCVMLQFDSDDSDF